MRTVNSTPFATDRRAQAAAFLQQATILIEQAASLIVGELDPAIAASLRHLHPTGMRRLQRPGTGHVGL